MKHLFTICALLLVSVLLKAQITIERSDITLEPGDHVVSWSLDEKDAFVPEHGENKVWDYSNLILEDSASLEFKETSSTDFPDANIVIRATISGLSGLATIPTDYFYSLDGDGYLNHGEEYEPYTVSLQPITGVATDSLTFLESKQVYNDPKIIFNFPLNYGDQWSTDNTLSFDFLISIAGFGLQDTPSGQTIREEVTDSVVGHGTLILPNPNGSGSVSMECLLTKRTILSTYNYFLGGQPAPQVMLDALGLTQGSVSIVTNYMFYAKGLPRAAATMGFFGDESVGFMNISDDIKDLTTSTADRTVEMLAVKAFPNPARESYQLNFDKPDPQTWTLEMFNILGRQVHHQSIESGDGPTQITVSCPSLHTGHYTYVLRNKVGSLMASGTVVLH